MIGPAGYGVTRWTSASQGASPGGTSLSWLVTAGIRMRVLPLAHMAGLSDSEPDGGGAWAWA